jgi:hypothetical protein
MLIVVPIDVAHDKTRRNDQSYNGLAGYADWENSAPSGTGSPLQLE